MKNIYLCPHCAAVLNPNVKIILVVRYRGRRGIILLSPQPGNFKFVLDGEVEAVLRPGAVVTFHCPVCAADLTSRASRQFAELSLQAPGQAVRAVQFNRKFGTHATFIIAGDRIKAYGTDADEFRRVNFFGV